MVEGFHILECLSVFPCDPLDWRQPFSFPFFVAYAVLTLGQVARTLALLSEAFRSEMASGAFQLSLVVLDDTDPLEWRQSLSASCLAPTLSKTVVTHLVLSFPLSFSFFPGADSQQKKLSLQCRPEGPPRSR